VITNGFIAYGVDILHQPVRFAQDRLPRTQVTQERSAAYELEGVRTDGKATSGVWEELGRRFPDYIDVYTQTAYDCYRIVVNSISRGEDLVNTGLQMLMLPPVRTSSHNILSARIWWRTSTTPN
jgi:hypothetical protein